MTIDTAFDFRSDSHGKDPDSYSPTLRRYHQLLWSKNLPNGENFDLTISTPGVYLHHRSELGEFVLSSDTMMPTYTNWQSLNPIVQQLSDEENAEFDTIVYTIGGMMIFPANQVDGKQTINAARGFTRTIADRFDLTLECIRRHYLNLDSPLKTTLSRYANFFELFGGFSGYVQYFLLEDLVDDKSRVTFFIPFDDFRTASIPGALDIYLHYRSRSIDFITARNDRIRKLEI